MAGKRRARESSRVLASVPPSVATRSRFPISTQERTLRFNISSFRLITRIFRASNRVIGPRGYVQGYSSDAFISPIYSWRARSLVRADLMLRYKEAFNAKLAPIIRTFVSGLKRSPRIANTGTTILAQFCTLGPFARARYRSF